LSPVISGTFVVRDALAAKFCSRVVRKDPSELSAVLRVITSLCSPGYTRVPATGDCDATTPPCLPAGTTLVNRLLPFAAAALDSSTSRRVFPEKSGVGIRDTLIE
jgi:hypothetical protein